MRINRNTRRSTRPVFRSVNSNRRRTMNNKRTLNSGRNYGTYCTFRLIDFPSFNIDTDRDAAINYLNTHTFADIPVKVDDIYEDHNTYRVHLTYDMDEETGFNAWVGKQNAESPIMDVDETTIYSLIYSVLSNWDRVDSRKMNSSRRRRRVLNSARSLDFLSFDELNDAQKDYVVKHALESSLGEGIWQWFNESLMEQYHYDVEELAKQYEERLDSEYNLIDFKIHTDELYWEESSQGPYPKWKFEKVFDSFTVTEDDSIDVEFNGGGLDVDKAAYFDVYRQDEDGEWQYDEYGDAPDASYKASEIIAVLQEFINKVWSLVTDVCTAYPDEDYIYDDLANNDYAEFVVTSETTAKPVNL